MNWTSFRGWSGRRQHWAATKYRKQISHKKAGKTQKARLTEALILQEVQLLTGTQHCSSVWSQLCPPWFKTPSTLKFPCTPTILPPLPNERMTHGLYYLLGVPLATKAAVPAFCYIQVCLDYAYLFHGHPFQFILKQLRIIYSDVHYKWRSLVWRKNLELQF